LNGFLAGRGESPGEELAACAWQGHFRDVQCRDVRQWHPVFSVQRDFHFALTHRHITPSRAIAFPATRTRISRALRSASDQFLDEL
jgi:hypothetical protein